MRRSPPASVQLTAIGAQKRPFEELTPSEAPTPDVDETPAVEGVTGSADNLAGESSQ